MKRFLFMIGLVSSLFAGVSAQAANEKVDVSKLVNHKWKDLYKVIEFKNGDKKDVFLTSGLTVSGDEKELHALPDCLVGEWKLLRFSSGSNLDKAAGGRIIVPFIGDTIVMPGPPQTLFTIRKPNNDILGRVELGALYRMNDGAKDVDQGFRAPEIVKIFELINMEKYNCFQYGIFLRNSNGSYDYWVVQYFKTVSAFTTRPENPVIVITIIPKRVSESSTSDPRFFDTFFRENSPSFVCEKAR